MFDEFYEDNFDDFDDAEFKEEIAKERARVNNLAIVIKAKEIVELTNLVCDTIDKENEMLYEIAKLMRDDAYTIEVKIKGAEAGDLYCIRMTNATIIRQAALNLQAATSGIVMFEYEETEYLDLIRNAINEFKPLFIEWVASFDRKNFFWDEWGLFNPPGAIEPDEDELF